MTELCRGRTCIVTGAGRGLGRAYALMLAANGANVVVNDLGSALDGAPTDEDPAQGVVDEITAAGGTAVVNHANVTDWDDAQRLVQHAIDEFGELDVLVNNAGVLRDRTLVKMNEDDWDQVIAVHLKGTFAPSHWAAVHWRTRAAESGSVDARLINTTSVSGLFGNVGQANYSAAKAGIAGFTIVASMELARYGVTANAVSPAALTRMLEGLREFTDDERAQRDPDYPAAVVTWLASPESAHVTGRVVLTSGTRVAVGEGWTAGPTAEPSTDPFEAGAILSDLVAGARANADMTGTPRSTST